MAPVAGICAPVLPLLHPLATHPRLLRLIHPVPTPLTTTTALPVPPPHSNPSNIWTHLNLDLRSARAMPDYVPPTSLMSPFFLISTCTPDPPPFSRSPIDVVVMRTFSVIFLQRLVFYVLSVPLYLRQYSLLPKPYNYRRRPLYLSMPLQSIPSFHSLYSPSAQSLQCDISRQCTMSI